MQSNYYRDTQRAFLVIFVSKLKLLLYLKKLFTWSINFQYNIYYPN